MAETKRMHVKTGDTVVVISGGNKVNAKDDKLKTGKILKTMPKEGRVVVEGVNMVSKHQKPRGAGQPGGIVKKEAPIDSSNVMLYCAKCKAPRKAKIQILDDAKKSHIRVCAKCGESFDK